MPEYVSKWNSTPFGTSPTLRATPNLAVGCPTRRHSSRAVPADNAELRRDDKDQPPRRAAMQNVEPSQSRDAGRADQSGIPSQFARENKREADAARMAQLQTAMAELDGVQMWMLSVRRSGSAWRTSEPDQWGISVDVFGGGAVTTTNILRLARRPYGTMGSKSAAVRSRPHDVVRTPSFGVPSSAAHLLGTSELPRQLGAANGMTLGDPA